MTTIQSRFERFASFAFSASGSFERGADLWDTISDYEPYLSGDREPTAEFVEKMEELGCSRRWLLYANGEMFADNEKGRILRYKFMQGIGLSSSKLSFTGHSALLQSNPYQEQKPQENKPEIKQPPKQAAKKTVAEAAQAPKAKEVKSRKKAVK